VEYLQDLLRRFLIDDPAPPIQEALSYQTETGMMLWSALGGAVIGAVFGGLIQAAISWLDRRAARQERHAAQMDSDRAAAYSCFIKASTMAHQLIVLHEELQKTVLQAADLGRSELPLWVQVPPIYGLPSSSVDLSTDDIAILFKYDLYKQSNELAVLNEAYRSTMADFAEYLRLRTDLMEQLPEAAYRDFDPASLPAEMHTRFRARFHRLEIIIDGVIGKANEGHRRAFQLADDIWPAFQDVFGEDRFPAVLSKLGDTEQSTSDPPDHH